VPKAIIRKASQIPFVGLKNWDETCI
jgi:hypothetical protein